MRRIAQHRRFKLDLKRQTRCGRDIEELIAVVELLAENGTSPGGYRPHRLTGEWKGMWECHIESDWLLITRSRPTRWC